MQMNTHTHTKLDGDTVVRFMRFIDILRAYDVACVNDVCSNVVIV